MLSERDGEKDRVEEWSDSFHGTAYLITLISNDRLLTFEVEDEETGDRWSGEFTAQYIEEITHKAGNFKKFSLFVEMLHSAFQKTNRSVFIDLLTLADLEAMKAKKTGGAGGGGAVGRSAELLRRNALKRYAILTYTGEFDRVHYPLPLPFEEAPNPLALQRTIRRLREKLKAKEEKDSEPANERERELRQLLSQLRQENQELKHQLRHSAKGNKGERGVSPSPSSPSQTTATAELAAQNARLKKALDEHRREVKDLSFQLERVKIESAKEVAKWQQRIGTPTPSNTSSGGRTPSPAGGAHRLSAKETQVILDLKKRLALLENELKLARLTTGHPTVTGGGRSVTPSGNRRPTSASMSTRETSRRAGRSASPQLPSEANSTAKPPLPFNPIRRYISPKTRSLDDLDNHSDPLPSHHYNPSSSLGRRFDPTAYQQTRKQAVEKFKTPSKRYDSPSDGYSSANSQSSKGSQRSKLSDSSLNSKEKKGKKKTKKKNSPPTASSHHNHHSHPQPQQNTSQPKPQKPLHSRPPLVKKELNFDEVNHTKRSSLLNEVSHSLDQMEGMGRKPPPTHGRNENLPNYSEVRKPLKTASYDPPSTNSSLLKAVEDGEEVDPLSYGGSRRNRNNPSNPLMNSLDTTASFTKEIFKKDHPNNPLNREPSTDEGDNNLAAPLTSSRLAWMANGTQDSSKEKKKEGEDIHEIAEKIVKETAIPELNKRIHALQDFLDTARNGLKDIATH